MATWITRCRNDRPGLTVIVEMCIVIAVCGVRAGRKKGQRRHKA